MSEERLLEELLKDTPQEKLDSLVSTAHLSQVARRLTNWPVLAPHLYIQRQQVKDIESSYPSNLQRQRLEFLQQWSEDQGYTATYRTLIQALYEVENRDLIDEICKMLKSSSLPPHPTLQKYAQDLRACYKHLQPPPIFQALAGNDEEGPSPSEKFINLVMTSRERVQRGGVDEQHRNLHQQGKVDEIADYMSERNMKVPVQLQDIFTLDSEEYKVILIEGAPGSGKTTLFWHICQRWSAGELFRQFMFVVLVKLRDPEVQNAKCLADILSFANRKEDIASEIIKRKGEGVLFLFDGWDELPKDLQRNSLFQTLIEAPHVHSLDEAAIVVSARPISSASLQTHITTRIEILGFTPDQIEEYVKTSLKSQPKAAASLITTIKQDPVLQGNCYLPLSIAIITHTFLCMKHALPATFCRIIEELALSCLHRHIKKRAPYGHLYRTLYSFDDLQADMQSQFNILCERAYNSLLCSEYSFDNPDTPTLGLMQSVQSFVVRGEKSTQHYFLHLSLHELCAAKHLVTLPEEQQSSIVDDVLMGKVSQMTNMLSFYSAFGGWMSTQTKQVLIKHVQSKFHFERTPEGETQHIVSNDKMQIITGREKWAMSNPFLMMLYSMYESQKPELCQMLPSKLTLICLPLATRDCIALKYIILHKKLESLDLEVCNSYPACEWLGIIAPALKRNMPEELILGHQDIEKVSILADAIIDTPLTNLSIWNCGITEKDVEILSCALCGSRMKKFCLDGNKIGNAGLRHIAHILTKTDLVYLLLRSCEIDDEGVVILSRILPRTKIILLDLSKNHISTRGLKALAEGIMRAPNFAGLCIKDSTTGTEGIKQFLITVTIHPTFCCLAIKEKDINEISDTVKYVNQNRRKLGHTMINVRNKL